MLHFANNDKLVHSDHLVNGATGYIRNDPDFEGSAVIKTTTLPNKGSKGGLLVMLKNGAILTGGYQIELRDFVVKEK